MPIWPRQLRRCSGFTLVELLVVIAVVALLVGLLAPSLAGARRVARSALCSSQLRQWGFAVNAYAMENAEYLPRRGQGVQPTTRLDRDTDWFNALPLLMNGSSYLDLTSAGMAPKPGDRSIWICPEAKGPAPAVYFAYAMNMRLSVWDAPEPDRIDQVAPPAVQVFLAEAPGLYCSVLPAPDPYSLVARHSGSTVLAFLDDHVAQFSSAAVGCGVGDPLRPEIQWHVPSSAWTGPGN